MNTLAADDPVVVDLDGRTASWSPSQGFFGDPDIVSAAQLAVDIGLSVDLGENFVRACDDDPLGAASALCAHRPGRTRILRLPESAMAAMSFAEPEEG